jgi:ABC-type multidrug transport system fused ATPase/permease subunit
VSTFLINTVVQGSLLWVGSILVERKMLSAGVLFAFMLYQYQLQNEVLSLLNSYTSLIKSSGAGDKVFVLIDREPPPPSTGNRSTDHFSPGSHFSERSDIDNETNLNCVGARSLDDSNAASSILEQSNSESTLIERRVQSVIPLNRHKRQYHIRFENVSFAYPSRSQNIILNRFNLEIPEGKTVALVGASGCGKTTIVNLLQRFYDPFTGRILVNGIDLRSMDVQMHRRHIGAVTQEPILFRGSLRDNITYGCAVAEEVRSEHVVLAAQLAHADGFIQTFPDQYETAVGERGVQLSGGQKQRIGKWDSLSIVDGYNLVFPWLFFAKCFRLAIARALIMQPSLLLLDEATSSLDTESELAVQQALDELLLHSNNQITTVVIAHRLRTVQNAHKIVVIQNGQVVEEGTHHALLLQPTGVYRRMVEWAGSTGVLLESGER